MLPDKPDDVSPPVNDVSSNVFVTPVRVHERREEEIVEEGSTHADDHSLSLASSSSYPSWIRPNSATLASISSSDRFRTVRWLGDQDARPSQVSPVHMQPLSELATEAMDLARVDVPRTQDVDLTEDNDDIPGDSDVAAFTVVDLFGSR